MRKRKCLAVGLAVIGMLFAALYIPENGARGNMAGDEEQLPENEEMLDLSGGFSDYEYAVHNYYKGNYRVSGIDNNPAEPDYKDPGNLFNGTHESVNIRAGHMVGINFPFVLKISPESEYIQRMRTVTSVKVYKLVLMAGYLTSPILGGYLIKQIF